MHLNIIGRFSFFIGDKAELAKVKHAGQRRENRFLVRTVKVQSVESTPQVQVLVFVADVEQLVHAALVGVKQILRAGRRFVQTPRLALLFRRSGEHLVEDVKVAFAGLLCRKTDLFEQISANGSTDQVPPVVKVELDEFAKPRAVVVANRLGISKRLQQRIYLASRSFIGEKIENRKL